MAADALRSEERIGLGVAVLAHAGLVALLLWRPPAADVVVPPERIEVTLSDDVGLTSTSPNPAADSPPDVAPTIGEPAPAEPESAPEPEKVEAAKPEPAKPAPAKPEPRPQPQPVPKPKPAPKPVPKPAVRPVARPAPKPAPKAAEKTAPAAKPAAKPAPKAAAPAKPDAKPGGSRIGSDFLEGVQGARGTTKTSSAPAAAAGPQVQASLLGAVSRAIKPHWQGKAPEGADSDKLVTILRWSLNRDGTLAGTPQIVRQEGITDANRSQASRHAEQAIRAVQLAAPFDLPDQYYDTWKRVTIRFDKRLSL